MIRHVGDLKVGSEDALSRVFTTAIERFGPDAKWLLIKCESIIST